jgi:ABC-2 type transport system permease protein
VARTATVYAHIVRSRVRAAAQYRVSFTLQVVGAALLSFIDFIAILVIFDHLPHLAGWRLAEVAFLYGSSYVVFKAADAVMTNFDQLPLVIRTGAFDQILTRPLGTLGQVITGRTDIRHLGGIVQGAAILVFAFGRLEIDWDPARVIAFIVMIICAFVIYCAIWIATNSVAFWTTDAREVANSVTYGGNFLTQFPMHIYGKWMLRLFGYVIPLAFVNYFPSLYILEKSDPTGAPSWFRFMSPVVALLSVVAARAIWRSAVRHYRSTGS